MTWGDLFDRAPDGVAVADVRRALAERRESEGGPEREEGNGRKEGPGYEKGAGREETEDDP